MNTARAETADLNDARAVLDDLAARGVELWAEGDQLRFRAPQGAFSGEMRERLKALKHEVLDLLRQPTRPETPAESAPPSDGRIEIVADDSARFEPFPMTDLQQAYWVGQSDTIELGGLPAMGYSELLWPDIEVPRFEAALNRVIGHHDMLRAVVLEDGRFVVREVVPAYEIEVVDLRGRDQETVDSVIGEMRRSMSRRRILPDTWPLFEMRVSHHDDRTLLHWSNALLMIDDLSYHVISDDLFRSYHQPEAPLTATSIRFRDVVGALRRARDGAAYKASLAFWEKRFDTLPPAPDLPLARRPGDNDRPRFQRMMGRSTPESWEGFRRHAMRAGVTPASALCAAYAEILAAWSRRPQFTLNMLFFNRPPWHPEIENVVGNFTSTILLDVDGATGTPLAERARAIQKRLWRYQEHSRVSGVEVLRRLHRRAAAGGASRASMPVVFAANMGLGTAPPAQATTNGTDSANVDVPPKKPHGTFGLLHTPQVLLDQQVHVLDGVMLFNWDAAMSHFATGVPEAMFLAYCELVTRLAEDELSWHERGRCWVPAAQRALQLATNLTTVDLGAEGRLMHHLFADQVALRPDRIAVIAGDRELSYRELANRSRQLGTILRERGAQPEMLVAVALPKGWRQVVATLGILESGAAYLPIDPGLPAARIEHLLERGEVVLAVTDEDGLDSLPWPANVTPIVVDTEAPVTDLPALEPTQTATDLAYVIFTSGSTGEPKGVMIEHRAAINTLLDLQQRFALGPDDRVFALSSLSFDLSVFDIFGMLGAGGSVVMPADDELREPQRWLESLERHGVTVWNSVPALMQMLCDHVAGRGGRLPASVRLAMLSGDWIPLALPDQVHALGTDVEVMSLGGATEASIWSILFPVTSVDARWSSIPYGKAMLNQAFHVLDDDLEPRPMWVPGQLYIGGVSLARGYWRDPEKSDAAFFDHPRTGERLYRTGDLGRYLPDATIEFLGREDLQVKIQGYRVELGEIEAALTEHPEIEGAWVVAVGENQAGKQLVAHVLPAPEREPVPTGADHPDRREQGLVPETLRDYLSGRLPAYMVPPSIRLLERPPLSPNGKVDRADLIARGTGGTGSKPTERVAPRNETELRLADLWQTLLGQQSVGVHDDFFALGGHSLLAVRLMAQIRQTFGSDLPLSALLGGGTIESLAKTLIDSAGEGSGEVDGAKFRTPGSKPSPGPLVRLRATRLHATGEGAPLHLVHPVGGNVLCYTPLARALPASWPVVGLEFPADLRDAADGRNEPTLEALAQRYIEALDAATLASASVRLGGWSMGGVIALEMARQLDARGVATAPVVMIDPGPPGYDPVEIERDEADLLAWFGGDLAGLTTPSIDRLTAGDLRHLPADERLGRLRDWAVGAGILDAELDLREWARLFSVFRVNARMLERYTPGPFAGNALLFETTATETCADAWAALIEGGVESHRLDANHYTIVQPPSIEVVARAIEDLLQ